MKKLFAKYSRINILVIIVIFLIASAGFYFTINYVQLEQVDNDLRIEEKEVLLYVNKYNQIPKTFSVDNQIIEFKEVHTPYTKRYFFRTYLRGLDGKLEDFRQIFFGVTAEGKYYKVTVSKSLEETDNLIKSILWVTSLTVLLILLASFVINRIVLKRLWKPFFDTLQLLRKFRIDKDQQLAFPDTTTEEFRHMIDTLELTTTQAKMDYLSLKTFSENASHEIQTPIAIIQSKLDLLIQDESLTETQSESLQAIYNAIKRLSRLNKSLLLLAKIENKQYSQQSSINLRKLLEDKMFEFRELWQNQSIDVNFNLIESSVYMNAELADVLLNNLLSNATGHNNTKGLVHVSLTETELKVSNTGPQIPLDDYMLFQRFYKSSQKADDHGLGLSIIKQICDVSQFVVTYYFDDGYHTFLIKWPSSLRGLHAVA